MDFENRGNIDYQYPVVSTGSSESKDFQKVTEGVKQKVAIMEALDEIDITEENQSNYIKSIKELNIPVQYIIDSAMDEDDLKGIIEKYKNLKIESEKDRIESEKDRIESEKDRIESEKDRIESSIAEDKSSIAEDKSSIAEDKNTYKEKIQNILKDFNGGKNESKYASTLENLKSEKVGDFDKGLSELKNKPAVLEYLVEDLKSDGKYDSFKQSLVSYDQTFQAYFNDIDKSTKSPVKQFSNVSFKSSDILEKLESNKGAVVDVDLEKNPPSSNMRLIGSEYGFEKEIDAQKIESIDLQTRNSVESIENSFGGIDKFERDFNLLKSDIGKSWGTENFYTNLGDSVYNFVSSSLATLNQTFEGLNIPSELMVTQGDLYNLKNINPDNPSDLKSYIETIEYKVQKLKQYLEQQQKEVYVKQKEYINQLLKSEKLYEDKQVEVLKFLNQTGFDLIPQELTNQLIKEFKSNIFDIPGVTLNPETIDLENSRFGESDSEKGGNKWKDNLVNFLEKLLYGEIGHKDSIFKGKEFKGELGSHISSIDFNKALIDSGIKSGTGFDIKTMRKNLENPIDNSQSGILERQ